MAIPRPILYRDAALADASGPTLQQGISVLVAGQRILAIRPTSNEGILHPDARIVDAGGSTIVPGMVDAHSHVTLPGGSHWIDRGFDAPDLLLEVAEHNGDLLSHAGVRWARDVGSPQAIDPRDGRKRALALRVRERWRADPTRPKMRVAGTWIAHSGVLQPGLDGEADSLEHGFELDSDAVAAMARQKMFLVSTLAIFRSWASFSSTTTIPRFVSDDGKERIARRRERAVESVRLAHRAGVRIAAGTDFGGGSLRANHLAWEVESLVEAGLKPWEALASATVRGGELLDDPDAGRIFEGGPADFFLVHGDPLTDPTALWRVWRVAWLTAPS